MLIARAGRDMPQVNEPLKQFLDAALAYDVNLELLNHPAGEHAFDIVTDDARTRQIIGRTLAFIHDVTEDSMWRGFQPALRGLKPAPHGP